MKKEVLIQAIHDTLGYNIDIALQTKAGKWYEKEYERGKNEIKTGKTYGVIVDGGSCVDFDVKMPKKIDNILKSFINQFISKWELKQFGNENKTKSQILKEMNGKTKRVSKYYFYTTLYGIGYFCMFMDKETFIKAKNIVSKHLKDNNIRFKTEFSDAFWVYRFVINKTVEIHNELLNSLVMK